MEPDLKLMVEYCLNNLGKPIFMALTKHLQTLVLKIVGIKPYRKIAVRYDRTAQRTLIKTGLRTGTEAGTTGTV